MQHFLVSAFLLSSLTCSFEKRNKETLGKLLVNELRLCLPFAMPSPVTVGTISQYCNLPSLPMNVGGQCNAAVVDCATQLQPVLSSSVRNIFNWGVVKNVIGTSSDDSGSIHKDI